MSASQPTCDTLVIQGWDQVNHPGAPLRYCMPYPYDVLSAAAYPAVTNARASGWPRVVFDKNFIPQRPNWCSFVLTICIILRVASYCTICVGYISWKATTVTTRIIHFYFVYVRNPKLKPFIFHWHCRWNILIDIYLTMLYLLMNLMNI